MPVTILELTPEMKKSAQQDGQALCELFGIAGAGASYTVIAFAEQSLVSQNNLVATAK